MSENEVTVEQLARELHESRRQPDVPSLTPPPDWDRLSGFSKDALMIRAQYLLQQFDIRTKAKEVSPNA